MPCYLVERYLPRTTPERLATTALRAKQAAEQLSAKGATVRYLHSTFLPQDEMCLCLFEASSAHAVAEVNEAAGLPYERISEAIHLTAEDLARPADTAAPNPTTHPAQGEPLHAPHLTKRGRRRQQGRITMPGQRLVRRQHGKMIAGVCAGLADNYNISVTRLRWAFVIFGLFGAGEIVYILLWILLPKEP
jgi:phage shock protein PspC (stress-responsive transcriptional regulator)